MKENLHPIDELFKNGLDEHQEPPPDNSWEKINTELDKEKVIYFGKRYNELKKIAIALFLLGFIVSVYALYLKSQQYKYINTHMAKGKYRPLPKGENNIVKDATASDKSNTGSGKPNIAIKTPETSTTNKQVEELTAKDQNNKIYSEKSIVDNAQNTLGENISDKSLVAKNSSGLVIKNKRHYIIDEKKMNLVHKKINALTKETISHNSTAGNNKQPSALSTDIVSRSTSFLMYDLPQQPSMFLLKNNLAGLNAQRNNISPFYNKVTSQNVIQHNISLTGFYSADKVSYHVREDNYSPGRRDKDDFKDNEQNASSFSAGLLIDYSLSSKFSIGSGVVYTTTSTSIFPKTIYAHTDNGGNTRYQFNCSAGYSYLNTKTAASPAPGDSIKAIASKTQIQYIAVPLNLKYHIALGRLSVNPAIGMSLNYLLSGTMGTTIVNSNNKENLNNNSINGLKSKYINGSLSLEVAYSLNRNFSLVVSPNERFAISSINKDTPVKSYPSVFGIYGGVKFNF